MDDLEALATRRFGKLSEAERRLTFSAPKGEPALCAPPGSNDIDPLKANAWGSERTIRAELIRWLCTNQEAYNKIDTRGVSVYSAKITGKLVLSNTNVPFSLRLEGCGLMDDALLTGVKIADLCLNGSHTRCLMAEEAQVKGNLLLQNGFSADGEVRLIGAQIGGTLNFEGSSFSNPGGCQDPREQNNGGKAIRADRIRVEGGVFLRNGFKADGEVMLNGAHIGGDLSCRRATFRNLLGHALSAENANVGGNVFFFDGFSAYGAVDLFGAKVGGTLNCLAGEFDQLILQSAVVKNKFVWSQIRSAHAVQLDLGNTSVGSLADDEKSWPARGNLHLDGFEYERISDIPMENDFGEVSEEDFKEIKKRLQVELVEVSPTDARKRLKWLDRDSEFKLQPYRQLAKVLREMGDANGEKRVLFEMESRSRAQARRSLILLRPIQWTADTIYRGTVGYGLHPLWALWELFVLWGLGFVLCRRAGAMAPKDEAAYKALRERGGLPAHYPPFSPAFYSLENCVPLLKFGQTDRWQPDPNPRLTTISTVAAGPWEKLISRMNSPELLRLLLWVMTVVGWVLATFCVAGLAGIIKRD
jgi:hypothetical protein